MTDAPRPADTTGEFCSQCGQPWPASACGPTHALVAHVRANVGEVLADRDDLRRALDRAEATTQRLRAALSHYAHSAHWDIHDGSRGVGWYRPIGGDGMRDGYEVARAALLDAAGVGPGRA